MSISDAIANGYVICRQPNLGNVDCSALRPIHHHAKALQRVLNSVDSSVVPRSPGSAHPAKEWSLVVQWLELVHGLNHVDVKRVDDSNYGWCSSADDYTDHSNGLATAYATEHVRLLYAWSAVERLLSLLPLPPLPASFRGPRRFSRATLFLKQSGAGAHLPNHYACVLRHLEAHVREDPAYEGLSLGSFCNETSVCDQSGLLLAVGNQLRNFPAHGDVEIPEPPNWGEGVDHPSDRLPSELHAPRLATRGLLLSLQLLLRSAIDDQLAVTNSWEQPELGWWTQRCGSWRRDPGPKVHDLLDVVHLEPPSPDDDTEDDDED